MCVNTFEALARVGFIEAVRAGKDGSILTHASCEINRSLAIA